MTSMTSKDIIIFVAVFAALGFSLYRKYVKKNQSTHEPQNKPGTSFPTTKDDDYEPYSKK
jgi:hypothetical protein